MKSISNSAQKQSKIYVSTSFKERLKSHFIAFAITIAAMTLFCIIMRITPFGDNTFLYDDVRREFIQYYVHLKRALLGDASLAYSRTKGMGGSMLGLFINYMSSPLNFIYVFFPVKVFPTVLTILIIFRFGLSAFTADVFLSHLNIKKSIPFAVSFAMSLWVFVSLLNPLWLDAIVMFPLLSTAALEYSRDTHNRRWFLTLILLTAFQFYLNYYTACMMMIFLAVWMIVRFICRVISFRDGLFVAGALISGILIMCPVIYPVYEELKLSEKSVGGSFISRLFEDAYVTNPILIISKLFSCSIDGKQVMFGMPHLFCGTVIVPLMIFFFISNKIDKKMKIQCGSLLIILFASFCLSPLDLIWHAGNIPNGYPYRYAFIFVGVMITSAAYSFDIILEQNHDPKDRETVFTKITAAFFVVLAADFLISFSHDLFDITWLSFITGLLGIAILIAEFVFLGLYIYQKKKVFLLILALICMGDLMLNQIKIVRASYIPCETMSEYETRYDDKSVKIDSIKASDDGFYRIEDIDSDPYDNMNDGMVYDYHGISHYSTGDHKSVRMFLKDIGFNYNGLYDQYLYGNTKTADSILCIKYLLANGRIAQNDNVFPVAVMIPGDTYIPSEGITDDPFAYQEEIARAFAASYHNEDQAKESENELFVPVQIDDMSIDSDPEKTTMTINMTTTCDGNIYFYLTDLTNISQNMVVSVNGHDISGYANASAIKILNFGKRNKGDTLTLTLTSYGDPSEADFGTPLIFTENMDMLSTYHESAMSSAVEVTETSSTKLTLHMSDDNSILSNNMTNDNKMILLSIPYEEGFSAYMSDSKEPLEVLQAFGALTVIKVPEGLSGDIVLDYHIPGVNIGIMLLIIGLIMLLIQYLILKNHKFS